MIRVVRVSGTIRKSEEELLRRARREVVKAKMKERSSGDGGEALGMFAGGEGKQKSPITGLMGVEEEDIIDLDDEEDLDDMSD